MRGSKLIHVCKRVPGSFDCPTHDWKCKYIFIRINFNVCSKLFSMISLMLLWYRMCAATYHVSCLLIVRKVGLWSDSTTGSLVFDVTVAQDRGSILEMSNKKIIPSWKKKNIKAEYSINFPETIPFQLRFLGSLPVTLFINMILKHGYPYMFYKFDIFTENLTHWPPNRCDCKLK